MKFKITIKAPDCFYDGIGEAIEESFKGTTFFNKEEAESAWDARRKSLNDAIKPWVEYGEYVTIEFDTVAKTATVLPR